MDKKSFCEQVNNYRNQLYMAAYAILKNDADAQDAVSSAILRMYEKLHQLREPRKFKAWMFKIVRNEALQMKRRNMETPVDGEMLQMAGAVEDHYDELWDVIGSLKEEFRIVIVLFYYNDLSLKEISQVLEIPVGTVKSRLKRGREQMKKALEGGADHE